MAVVSRSAFASSLATKINDNTSGQVSAQDVREVVTDLEDSVAWGDEAVLKDTSSNLTAGYTTTPHAIGTVSSGTTTLDIADGQIQTLTNNGAFTLAPPSDSGSLILQITNGASAGTITTSGFTVVRGSFTTTDGAVFLCTVAVVGARSYLIIN
jgi:hypothetical protein